MIQIVKEQAPVMIISAALVMGLMILIEETYIYFKQRKHGKK
jgi:Ni/Fe-hydrogenase subunit HybB-like protein